LLTEVKPKGLRRDYLNEIDESEFAQNPLELLVVVHHPNHPRDHVQAIQRLEKDDQMILAKVVPQANLLGDQSPDLLFAAVVRANV
jgi:hypothetical protein